MIRLRMVVPPDLKREKLPVAHLAATVFKKGIVFLQANDRKAIVSDFSIRIVSYSMPRSANEYQLVPKHLSIKLHLK
jgi:hypothetical protein